MGWLVLLLLPFALVGSWFLVFIAVNWELIRNSYRVRRDQD